MSADPRGVSRWVDRTVLLFAILTTAACLGFLFDTGRYYLLPLWDRPDSPLHQALKPSGAIGHAFGYAGAGMVIIGVMLYSSRKRVRALQGKGPMRSWLGVHIYLCLTGPVIITLHTAMKLHGFGVYSFWSMWIVAASGIAGRWLYQQFPRTIRGTEMTIDDVRDERKLLRERLISVYRVREAALDEIDRFAERSAARLKGRGLLTLPLLFIDDVARPMRVARLRRKLQLHFPAHAARQAIALVKRQVALERRVAFLEPFKRLFLYWHITHLIFFFAMFILLVIHIGSELYFGASLTSGFGG